MPTRLFMYAYLSAFALLLTVLSTVLTPAWAQEEPPPVETKQEAQEDEGEEDDDEVIMLDNIQRGVERSVNAAARWFDHLFASDEESENNYRSRGRLSVAPEWSQHGGWKVRSRFRAQVDLPIAENRFSAFIGQVDTDDFVVGDDRERRPSVVRQIGADTEWLVGLGFNPGQGEESRFSITGGIRGGLSADLYAEGRYLWQWRFTDTSQIRTRSALFWRDSDGYGFDQRLDYEQIWGPRWLSRISIEAVVAKRVEGVRLRNSNALYYIYRDDRAIAGEFWYRGESRAPVSDEDFGLRLIHRNTWLRDWFFVESWGGMHWPKDEPGDTRKGAWLVGIQFEIWYGQ